MRIHWLPLVTLVAIAGCDPETPVQETSAAEEIEGRVNAHATDPNTHTNLNVAAGQITGEITGGQIADGTIGFEHIESEGVGSDEIADGSIAAIDIGQGAVDTLQLADDAVDNTKLADTCVDTLQLVDLAVTGAKIAPDTITAAQINTDAVTSDEILNDTIVAADIDTDAVTAAEIAMNAVTDVEIATDAVRTAEIMDGQVQMDDIANVSVTTGKLANAAVTHLKSGLRFVGEQQDANNMNFDTIVFNFTENNMDRTIRIIGVCESNVAGSEVRLADDDEGMNNDATCPDTDLLGPPAFFDLSVTADDADGDEVRLLINAGMANGFVRWTILNITATP